MQPFQPLTQDQWQKAQDAGFSPDQIIANEKQRKLESTPQQSFFTKVGSTIKGIGNVLTSSEQAFGSDIAGAIGGNTMNKNIEQQNQALSNSDLNNIKTFVNIKNQQQALGKDTSHIDQVIKNYQTTSGTSLADLYPSLNKSNLQVLGDAGGVLADILSVGSYGREGAKSFELLKSVPKVAPVAETLVKPTLSTTLKTIGKQTAIKTAEGTAVGYGSDVIQNAQQGKTLNEGLLKPGLGTATGFATPLVIGGIRAGVVVTKELAPRFINSLIKPSKANFSYGKDPGRTVSEMGITGNSLPDFEKNIRTAKNDVIGSQIGAIYDLPQNSSLKINTNEDINKLNDAIREQAKGGKNNQSIVNQLTNIRDALLFEHGIDKEGNIVRQGNMARSLSNLSPNEAQALIGQVADHTQFTGKPSDDKEVNSILKNIYGGIREKINNAVSPNNPEILKLNQQYSDLTSAELAVKNRNSIVNRADLINLKTGGAAVTGIISAILTGGGTIPVILAGATAAGVEKAFESTAVKTRVASWLGNQSPNIVSKFLQNNPSIAPIIRRQFPQIMSKIGSQ